MNETLTERLSNPDEVVTPGDFIHAAADAVAGIVPGGSNLLSLIMSSPLEKRRSEWMSEVNDRLYALQLNKGVTVEDLSNNDLFIDTVFRATTMALKTSEEHKKSAFKNAIVHVALKETPDETLCQIFLNLIDAFTVWHIKLLAFFRSPSDWYSQNGKTPPCIELGWLTMAL